MVRTADEALLKYVGFVAGAFTQLRPDFPTCCEGYVLDHGKLALSEELTAEEWRIVREAWGRASFPIKSCFWNAKKLSRRSGGLLVYHEGYALGAVIPVLHAWCQIGDKVIDPTWRHHDQPERSGPYRDRTMGLIPEDNAYLGVPFEESAWTTDGSLIDDWKHTWPLLRSS